MPPIPWPWAALFLCIALLAQELLLRWFGAQPSLSQAVYRVSVMTLGVASLALILLPPRRPAYLLGFLVCAALMAWALWLQYGEGLEPCPLCMFQRVAVSAVGVVFLIAAIHNPRRAGAAFYAVLTLLIAGAGAAFAARQIWLQALPKDQVPSCGMGLNYMMETMPFTDVFRARARRQRRMRGKGLGVPRPVDRRLDVRVLRQHDRRRHRADPPRLNVTLGASPVDIGDAARVTSALRRACGCARSALAQSVESFGEPLLEDRRHLRRRVEPRHEHEVGAGVVELERRRRAVRRHDDAGLRTQPPRLLQQPQVARPLEDRVGDRRHDQPGVVDLGVMQRLHARDVAVLAG